MTKSCKKSVLVILICYVFSACNSSQNSENKEIQLLRKENELAKKEIELTKRELDLSKGNTVNSTITNSTQSLSPAPTSVPKEITESNVRLRFINDARACHVIKGIVTLKVKNKTFTAKTDKKGFADFNKVPCGDVAEVSVFDSETSYESDTPVRQKISCAKTVFLGSFNIYYGNKVSEQRANYCYNLNPN